MAKLLVKRKSSIHGNGIFATRRILSNTIFYLVPDSIVDNQPHSRWARVGERWICDGVVLNYVNHSCSPNAVLVISDPPRLMATQKIELGEEITVDYDKTEDFGKKVPCNCQSKNCRGYFLRVE